MKLHVTSLSCSAALWTAMIASGCSTATSSPSKPASAASANGSSTSHTTNALGIIDLSPYYGKTLNTQWKEDEDTSPITFRSLTLNKDGSFSGTDEYLADYHPAWGGSGLKTGTYTITSTPTKIFDPKTGAETPVPDAYNINLHFDQTCREPDDSYKGLTACKDLSMGISADSKGITLADPGNAFSAGEPDPTYN